MKDLKGNEIDNWFSINTVEPGVEIADSIVRIDCDTRDFAVVAGACMPEFIQPESCNWEAWQNGGLDHLQRLWSKPNADKYLINKNEIVGWLKELKEASGGDKEWRSLYADIKNGNGWELKYIRCIRHPKMPDMFVVCNSYLYPVHWREIIPKMDRKITLHEE